MAETPPPEIAQLVRLIGEPGTLMLIELHGGTRITIPAGADTKLAREVGVDAAAALFGHFGHERVFVPLVKAWRTRLYRRRGMSIAEIARKLGCTENTVHVHLREIRPADTQLSLPFGYQAIG